MTAPLDGAREALADALSRITATAVNLPGVGYSIVAEDMANALLAALSSSGYWVVEVEEQTTEYGTRNPFNGAITGWFSTKRGALRAWEKGSFADDIVQRSAVASPWVPVSGEGRDD